MAYFELYCARFYLANKSVSHVCDHYDFKLLRRMANGLNLFERLQYTFSVALLNIEVIKSPRTSPISDTKVKMSWAGSHEHVSVKLL
jgi:hypothetical protein